MKIYTRNTLEYISHKYNINGTIYFYIENWINKVTKNTRSCKKNIKIQVFIRSMDKSKIKEEPLNKTNNKGATSTTTNTYYRQ